MTLNATCVASNAWLNPPFPTAPAMMILGVILILLVTSLLTHGLTLHCSWPSLTICPAMVHTIPADVPDSRSASAKTVPAAGASVEESRAWMSKREAEAAFGELEREAPATMRMAELTKRAKVNREMASSAME